MKFDLVYATKRATEGVSGFGDERVTIPGQANSSGRASPIVIAREIDTLNRTRSKKRAKENELRLRGEMGNRMTQGRKIREDHKILQIADCSLQLANGHDSVINLTVYGACPSTKIRKGARFLVFVQIPQLFAIAVVAGHSQSQVLTIREPAWWGGRSRYYRRASECAGNLGRQTI